MCFYVSTVLIGILLTFTVAAYFFDWGNGDWCLWLIGTVLVGLFTFGIIVTGNVNREVYYPISVDKISYSKTNSTLTIELFDNFTQSFKDAATYNKIDKVNTVYDVRGINFYGFEIERKIVVK